MKPSEFFNLLKTFLRYCFETKLYYVEHSPLSPSLIFRLKSLYFMLHLFPLLFSQTIFWITLFSQIHQTQNKKRSKSGQMMQIPLRVSNHDNGKFPAVGIEHFLVSSRWNWTFPGFQPLEFNVSRFPANGIKVFHPLEIIGTSLWKLKFPVIWH